MADKAICAVPGCVKPVLARNLCNLHYIRSRRGRPLEAACNVSPAKSAEVYRAVLASDTDQCVIWPLRRGKNGYATWSKGDYFSSIVSRQVCKDMHGLPPTARHEAAHSCGNGHLGCVNPRHLSWKTPVENAADKQRHGTELKGTQRWMAKLTEDDVRAIRRMRGVGMEEIGALFGVTRATIWAVLTGRTWRHVAHEHDNQET